MPETRMEDQMLLGVKMKGVHKTFYCSPCRVGLPERFTDANVIAGCNRVCSPRLGGEGGQRETSP